MADDHGSSGPKWRDYEHVFRVALVFVARIGANIPLPGIDPKDVEVSVEDASLTVTGSRKFEQETDEEGYHRVERRFGSFTRTIALPASADADRVEATFNRGVLTIETSACFVSAACRASGPPWTKEMSGSRPYFSNSFSRKLVIRRHSLVMVTGTPTHTATHAIKKRIDTFCNRQKNGEITVDELLDDLSLVVAKQKK